MAKLPQVTGKEAMAAFQKAGFVHDRTNGSHHIMKKVGCDSLLSIPVHAGKKLGRGLLRTQIDGAGLTVQEFIDLL